MSRKKAAHCLILCLLLGLCACQSAPVGRVQVAVELRKADGEALNRVLTMKGGQTAKDAFIQLCEEKKIAYTDEGQGLDGLYGIHADEDYAWVFYLGSRKMEQPPGDYVLQKNDSIAYRYEKRG